MLQRGQQCPESPEGSRDSLLVVGRRWGTAQTVGNSTERGESGVRGGSLWFRQQGALPLNSVTRICYFPFPRLRFNLYPWRGTGY